MSKYLGYSDAQLIHALSMGEEKAFVFIYVKNVARLLRFIESIIDNREDAEEIVQEIFESLWSRRESLNHVVSIQAYLFKMAKYCAIEYMDRKKSLLKRYAIHHQIFSAAYDSAEEGTTPEQLIVLVEQKIAELPPRCREAITLRFRENLPYKDIALRMNVSLKTVEQQVMKALAHLRGIRMISDRDGLR